MLVQRKKEAGKRGVKCTGRSKKQVTGLASLSWLLVGACLPDPAASPEICLTIFHIHSCRGKGRAKLSRSCVSWPGSGEGDRGPARFPGCWWPVRHWTGYRTVLVLLEAASPRARERADPLHQTHNWCCSWIWEFQAITRKTCREQTLPPAHQLPRPPSTPPLEALTLPAMWTAWTRCHRLQPAARCGLPGQRAGSPAGGPPEAGGRCPPLSLLPAAPDPL